MVSGYDPDERIHRPAPSFLSRPPTGDERRRLRRLLAALPRTPELVFWPESIAIDGPWSKQHDGRDPRPSDRRHRPDGPDTGRRSRKGPAADRRHRPDGPDSHRPHGRNGRRHHRRQGPIHAGATVRRR